MRQILATTGGAVVARMPRPEARKGTVLVRVRYSMISVGTEAAGIRPQPVGGADASPVERVKAYKDLAQLYLGLAAKNPKKAVRKAGSIVKKRIGAFLPTPPPPAIQSMGELTWAPAGATVMRADGEGLAIEADESTYGYQATAGPVAVADGMAPVIRVVGAIAEGSLAVGVLSENGDRWLASQTYDAGTVDDLLSVDPGGSKTVTLVIANAGTGAGKGTFSELSLGMTPAGENAGPVNELNDVGWNVGYSAAGEVVAVGAGIDDLRVGDLVACGGAGKANHADYIEVPRNLACPVPKGVDLKDAATSTVGTIAMQGVRRAQPELGDKVCVIGLGLLGQLGAQMFGAAGCSVYGMDLDPKRVKRAMGLGMTEGAGNADDLKKLVRDRTGGHGADITYISAATKSDAVINLAMEVTRRKGKVIIVGDVGLGVERPQFYKKEIDLLMSSSYGPGRYDATYEEEGIDYPYAYVRWTLNRNMRAYMELIGAGKIDVAALIDRETDIDQAPVVYKELAEATDTQPLGIIIRYPDTTATGPDPFDATAIHIKGARPAADGPIRYALIGAGAFGQAMLVPQLEKQKEVFALHGVVSRDATRGGAFARANRLEVLASDPQAVFDDRAFGMVVIATRHDTHADLAVRAIEAGKIVFVEKPLALTWEELDRVARAYAAASNPLLMVGFNRRFAPAAVRLREELNNRRSPVVINYRLNGGYIPLDSWMQGREGGGRNLGEACHMYDFFRSFVRSPATSVSATGIRAGDLPYRADDNFSATVGYEDGSVGNLLYTALGPKQGMPKERIEIFCDGEAYLIDDFKTLTRASDGEVLWSGEVDKGHAEEMRLLGLSIKNGAEAPIPFGEIVETSAVALRVQDLLTGRGGDD